MGDGYGPMVVVRKRRPNARSTASPSLIPGTWTTAWLALQLYQPGLACKVMPFDQILEAVRDGQADAGLIIHEGQLTYEEEGLRKAGRPRRMVGRKTGGLPLPLGGNIIRRDLGPDAMRRVSRLLHASIAYALDHRADALRIREAVRPRAGRGRRRTRSSGCVSTA